MTDGALLSLLIPAVGGQGGGVLLEWIVDAATADGYSVHGTSIPGVAQRTGSTSYYVELATERGEDDAPPIFSLYPVPGALDVLLAPEFLEVGRSIELGFPSPARTTIVASTHRLYSIHEKIVTGLGIYPIERLHEAARAFSRSMVAFDALALAREHRTEANAVLLGAYTLSCHSCRHLCGGNLDLFSRSPRRHRVWRWVSSLKSRHMPIAWTSLVAVAFADLYVRLCSMGIWHDWRIF